MRIAASAQSSEAYGKEPGQAWQGFFAFGQVFTPGERKPENSRPGGAESATIPAQGKGYGRENQPPREPEVFQ